ncbi:MAG: hypothetical protein K2Z80_24020 [Xanthobacteraceae bacterium]|nr:hypothetical protein [Xanthobacteraceae bacterium]
MVASTAPSILPPEAGGDFRSLSARTLGPYRAPTLGKGEFRNVYRRANGALRMGPAWRDREAASLGREVLPGVTFVECRDTRWEMISGSALVGAA